MSKAGPSPKNIESRRSFTPEDLTKFHNADDSIKIAKERMRRQKEYGVAAFNRNKLNYVRSQAIKQTREKKTVFKCVEFNNEVVKNGQ